MKTKLKKGETYMVWEPGMNEWLEMEYVGFNKLTDDHIFKSTQENNFYMYVNDSDVEDEVK